MVGNALQKVRAESGLTMDQMGAFLNMSSSMVNEMEHSRKQLPKDRRPEVARALDDGRVYLEIKRESVDGVSSPWLDNIDDHRVVAVMKYTEEVGESIEALRHVLPILLRAQCQGDLRTGEREDIEAALLEMIEATTAAENALARLAKSYGISLAELYDRHQAELVEKGYLKKEERPRKAAR